MGGEDPFKFPVDLEEDGTGRGSSKGHNGLSLPQLRAAPTGLGSGAMKKGGTIGSRNVDALKGKLAKGSSKQAGSKPSLFQSVFGGNHVRQGTEGRTPPSRSSERVAANNKVGSGEFFNIFNGTKHDGPRQVSVNTRTVGTAVQGKRASKLREQSDDEVAEVLSPGRSRRDARKVQGAAAVSRLNGTNGRASRRTDEGRDDEVEPDSEEESEPAKTGAQYSRRENRQKDKKRGGSAEKDMWEASGAGSRRGDWRNAKRRASEGDDGEEFQLPPAKRDRPSQQTTKLDKDPEYKPGTSRCAVKRAAQNTRKAKPEVQVINLDSEETPQKDKPTESEPQEGVPRRLILEKQGAGPSSTLLNEDNMYQTGSCWLGKFAAQNCTVYFDAHRLRITVPSKYVQGGAEAMTFHWGLDELADGNSFLVESDDDVAKDRLLAFHFKGEVHPALSAYLDPKSRDLHARMVAFELDADEWKARRKVSTWPDALKGHFVTMTPEYIKQCTNGRPAESAALLNPKADQRQRAAALASEHYTRPSRHQKPSIQTFHFPPNDPDAVTISTTDLARLEPHEFLNDTLIDFYIKFLQVANLSDEHAGRIHIVNSFFFKKLTETAQEARKRGASGEEAFRRMNKWTRKVDIFLKDFVIVPVNQSLHWSLAIIVYPGGGDSINGKLAGPWLGQRTPCILQLDSMAGGHTNVEDLLRQYLTELWLATHPDEERPKGNEPLQQFSRTAMPFIQVKVPQQDNHCDCGLFLLHYVEQFIADPPPIFDRRLGSARKGHYKMTPNWFTPGEASVKRAYLRELVIRLAGELAQGNTAILDRGSLNALWTDVTHGGSDAGVGTQKRRADRGIPPAEDEIAEARRKDAPKPSAKRPRKEEGKGGPVLTSAYDEELERTSGDEDGARAAADGRESARAAPLTEEDLRAALKEDPGAAVDPDNPLSVDLDPSPQKRKRSPGAANEGGDAGAADASGAAGPQKERGSSEESGPLAFYRRRLDQIALEEKAEAVRPSTLNQAVKPAGAARQKGADVRRRDADERVPDSEDEEEEARRGDKRERSDTAGSCGGFDARVDRIDAEAPRKRARSEGLETASAQGGRSEFEQSPAAPSENGGEGSGSEGEAVARREVSGSAPGRGIGAGRGLGVDSASPSSSDGVQRSEGISEEKGWQRGMDEKRSEVRELTVVLDGGGEAEESGGEKEPGERSGMQLVIHPVLGELHEIDELGGSPLSDNDGEDGAGESGAPHERGWSERGAAEGAGEEDGAEEEAVRGERGDDQWSREEEGNRSGAAGGRFEDGNGGEGGWFAARDRGESPDADADSSRESSEEPSSFAQGTEKAHRRSGSTGARSAPDNARLKKDIAIGVMRAVSRTQGGEVESSGREGAERESLGELGAAGTPGAFRARWAPVGSWSPGEKGSGGREEENVRDRPAGLAGFFGDESMEGREGPSRSAHEGGGAEACVTDGEENENEVDFLGEAVKAPRGDAASGQTGEGAEKGALRGAETGVEAGSGSKRTPVETILQKLRAPKKLDGESKLGGTKRRVEAVERQGEALSRGDGELEGASRSETMSGPTEEMLKRAENALDRLNARVRTEQSLAELRQGNELETVAQPQPEMKKIDRMRARATQNLLSGSPQRPSRDPGYGEGSATELRVMLDEPTGLAPDEANNPGPAEVPDSPVFEPGAHERGPVSQNFSQEDDQRSESTSAEAESWDREGLADHRKGGPSGEHGGTSDRFLRPGKTDRASLTEDGDARSTDRETKRFRSSLDIDADFKHYLAEGRRDDEAEGTDAEEAAGPTDWSDELVQGVTIPGAFPPEPASSGFQFLPLGEKGPTPSGFESGKPVVTKLGEPRRGLRTQELVPAPDSGTTAPAEDDDCTIVSAPSRSPLFGPPGHQGTRAGATRPGPSGTGRSPRNGEVHSGGGRSSQNGGKAGDSARSFANGLVGAKGKANLLQTGAVIRRGSGQANGSGFAEGVANGKSDGLKLTGFEDLDPDEDSEGFEPERRQRRAGVEGGTEGMGSEDEWKAGGENGLPLSEGGKGGAEDWADSERLGGGERKGPRLSFGFWQERGVPESEGERRKWKSLEKLMRETPSQEQGTGGEGWGDEREERTPPPRDVAVEEPSRHRAPSDVGNGVRAAGKAAETKREVLTVDSDEDEETGVDESAGNRPKRSKRTTLEKVKSPERNSQLEGVLARRAAAAAVRSRILV
ncbi:Ulp1 protease family protein [Klebsormidium nitens]|uniref:Ulp1 protease family protein n=1 Tax=Klebsormidium nitens TaxID=105231 RepID=A0A1Y1IA61_KLENI|nr:Ulp1 protease family protein [Klebsormidium nitens]|eukprot:GAQ85607.1 Ulp1 protease family protein [Klebsormidium nitens]